MTPAAPPYKARAENCSDLNLRCRRGETCVWQGPCTHRDRDRRDRLEGSLGELSEFVGTGQLAAVAVVLVDADRQSGCCLGRPPRPMRLSVVVLATRVWIIVLGVGRRAVTFAIASRSASTN
jgi:hypothetical protein